MKSAQITKFSSMAHLLVFVCQIALCGLASAQSIHLLGANGDLYSVNPKTGEGVFIGFTGHHTYLWNGLAIDSNGKIFSATGDEFSGYQVFEIDPDTGNATFVVQTNLDNIGCMAFDENDVLYIAYERDFPLFGSPVDLVTLDLTTGQHTLIGETGVQRMLAMDFHGGALYGFPIDDGLVTIDTSTGQATDINPNLTGFIGSSLAICFNDQGALYYINDALWMLDSQTGVPAPIDWIDPFGYWGEAVFVEGDSPQFALWLAGTAGHYMGAKVSGATPNGQVGFVWAKGNGGPTPIPSGYPCTGTLMDLNSSMQQLDIVSADANGFAAVGPLMVHPAAAGLVYLQAIDITSCETSNRILLYY